MLEKIIGSENVLVDEPMLEHTSFKIGGTADFVVQPQSVEALCEVVAAVRGAGIPLTIIGNGSNLLVSDKGIRGVVVKISQGLSEVTVDGCTITVQGGALLTKLANAAQAAGLTGLEFATGIPGTVGGAIVMNAGAYDGEMKDVCVSVTCLDEFGLRRTLSGAECEFGYRSSVFQRENWVILESSFRLKSGGSVEIRKAMDEIMFKRKSKQPLEFPSAGSAFKRPVGGFASKLVDDAGLKGFRVGGAMVSEKHAGFVINVGGATAADVRELLERVQDKVFVKFGIKLEPEVKMIGEM